MRVGKGIGCWGGGVWGEKGGEKEEVLVVIGEKGEAAEFRRNSDLRGLGEASQGQDARSLVVSREQDARSLVVSGETSQEQDAGSLVVSQGQDARSLVVCLAGVETPFCWLLEWGLMVEEGGGRMSLRLGPGLLASPMRMPPRKWVGL